MESGVPMLNCLVQHTLRSLCFPESSSNSAKWVYAVFWRVIPRNYPPPKWDHRGCILDRAKGNRRNWILVWEDGFCDFCECERAGSGHIKGRFGADVYFKMSHEVYSFGEGLIGKVAADKCHKWVFRDSAKEKDSAMISAWNVSLDPQPRAWEAQFASGIETIAVVSVREGVIQLGSFDKVEEDLNLVISIQRRFNYLQSLSGVYALQRPCLPTYQPYTFKPTNPFLLTEANEAAHNVDDKHQLIGSKRLYDEPSDNLTTKSINLGYNSPQNVVSRPPTHLWSIPPLLPSMPRSLGALLAKMPSVAPGYDSLMLNIQSNNLIATSHNAKTGEGILSGLQMPDMKEEVLLESPAAQKEILESK